MVDYAFKVIVVGQAGVGKTAIVRRFIKKYFPEGEHPTIGVDIGVKVINVGDKKVQLKIWDSAGSERFKSLTTSYFRNADAAILVYSITQSESLYELEDWCKEITNHGDMLRILVGNKNDLNEHREISQDLAVNFAVLENIDLAIETSAKNDENINYLFYTVAEKLVNGVEYESFRQEHPYSTSKDMLKYSSTSKSMEKLFQSPRSRSSFYLSRKSTFKKNVFQKFCVII